MKRIGIIIIVIIYSIRIFGQCLGSEQVYKEYFNKNISTIDPIEGIYSVDNTYKMYQNNQLVNSHITPQATKYAIKKDGYSFKICDIIYKNEIIELLNKTASQSVYLFQKTFSGSNTIAKTNAIISSNGSIEYSYEIPQAEVNYSGIIIVMDFKLIKLYPTQEEIEIAKQITVPTSPVIPVSSSGTGFALTSDGYIITNDHVINDATKIIIKGINGDFSKSYKAKIIVADKNNDLAIIKIDDYTFNSLGTIPYVISNKSCDVGCSIFCLGYPLRASMGDEVKLTNGIISSKSGFQGDITSYQISAPVQPGNSGGPLFDEKGNLVGVVNSRHLGAENVAYAIKISYLLNLIDIMSNTPKLQTISTISNKSLSEQVKIIKNFIYIIETN
jgi:S1-C subfamily serine protease